MTLNNLMLEVLSRTTFLYHHRISYHRVTFFSRRVQNTSFDVVVVMGEIMFPHISNKFMDIVMQCFDQFLLEFDQHLTT